MDDCIFCKIIKGELDSAKVYEDDETFVFMDVNPVSEGHCLVIPKKHYESISDIDDETLKNVMIVGKKIAKSLQEKLPADGINFLQSNGKAAGQAVFHFHLHVIPRRDNDGLRTHGLWGERILNFPIEDLKKLAQKIKL